MALWTKKNLTRIFPAKLEKVPPFVLLILQFNIYIPDNYEKNKALNRTMQNSEMIKFIMVIRSWLETRGSYRFKTALSAQNYFHQKIWVDNGEWTSTTNTKKTIFPLPCSSCLRANLHENTSTVRSYACFVKWQFYVCIHKYIFY